MFPEYRELIAKLKVEDDHFARLFEEHNKLDNKIDRLTKNPVTSGLDQLEFLKREKLRLKDEMLALLKAAAQKSE